MKYVLTILLTLLVSACASVPLEAIRTDINTDKWDVGFQRDFGTGKGYIREFVPKGESIKDWSKLVSIEFIEGDTPSLNEYIHEFRKTRESQCPGTRFEVLSEEEYSITYIFSFPACQGHQMQAEVSRIFLGNDGIHRLSYAEKTEALDQETIDQWLSEFDKSYVVKGPKLEPIR